MIAIALMINTTASSTTIAAAVSALNSAWGRVAHAKMVVGSAVYGPSHPLDQRRARGLAEAGRRGADEQQRRRLAERAGDGQDDAGEDARCRVRQDVAADHLPLRGPDAEACFANWSPALTAALRPR